jgi:sugar/nucleoside kinase (ribokinase family)
MKRAARLDPIDYLMIGHITHDLVPGGNVVGGTASYAARMARALGLRVGIVTACESCTETDELDNIPVAGLFSDETTTFENIQTPQGRIQRIHNRAPDLDLSLVPEEWRSAPIVHLGPVANEVDPNLVRAFPTALIGVTPQGWMREWDRDGRVRFTDWLEAEFVLQRAGAAVLSIEDVHSDESYIEDFATNIRILAVTEGASGSRIYWNGDVKYFKPPKMVELDPTGAGDIFATAFFTRLYTTRDPWEAGRFATHLAAYSVQRRGLEGIPTPDEIQAAMTEIIETPDR